LAAALTRSGDSSPFQLPLYGSRGPPRKSVGAG